MRRQRSLFVAILLLFIILATVGPGMVLAAPAPKAPARAPLETTAVSAILMDGNGNVLYEKDSHKELPPASVTKVMTLLLGVEAVEQDRLKLTDPIYSSENAWRQGGSQIWLEPGESMTAREMLTAVAVVSANDAAVALMEHIYGSEPAAVEAMNKRAEELGLRNTRFINVNGLPAPGHYMSAYDTAVIAREALKHPLYMELCGIKEHWLRGGKNWLVNTNKLLWWYKGGDGLKTGWTEDAKYCFVGTAKRDDLRLIAVVFATPEPRSHLRESMKLMDWGFANFTATPIVAKGDVVDRLPVSKGTEREVNLVALNELNLVLPKGQQKNLQKKVVSEGSVTAPVAEGQKCGELIVLKDGQEIGKVALVAEKAVAKASFLRVMHDLLGNLFSLAK
jgi:D-alanyl-D-alanine carboxypeptidase